MSTFAQAWRCATHETSFLTQETAIDSLGVSHCCGFTIIPLCCDLLQKTKPLWSDDYESFVSTFISEEKKKFQDKAKNFAKVLKEKFLTNYQDELNRLVVKFFKLNEMRKVRRVFDSRTNWNQICRFWINIQIGGGEPAARVNIWYGTHQNFVTQFLIQDRVKTKLQW